jgi:hypothetical protein
MTCRVRQKKSHFDSESRCPLSNSSESGLREKVSKDLNFRAEALRTRSVSGPGSTTLAVPLPFAWYSFAALCLICMIVALLVFGTYTTTEKAEAVVMTDGGLSFIDMESSGIVERHYVQEGDPVQVGTPLLAVSVEDYGDSDLADGGEPDSTLAGSSDGAARGGKLKVVKSNFEGIVYQLPLRPGSEYKSYMNLAVIARSGNPSVTVLASAKARSSLKAGDMLNLVLQGERGTDARVHGRVTQVAMSPVEQYSRETRMTYRTYRVDIQIGSEAGSRKSRGLIGKTVEVRMPMQKRRLYQWFFDPLKRIFDAE